MPRGFSFCVFFQKFYILIACVLWYKIYILYLVVLYLKFKSLIHSKFIFGSGAHSSTCCYSGFPIPCIEETMYTQIYFWALNSLPLVSVSIFMPVPYRVDCYSFVVQFDIRKCGASNFVLLCHNCLTIWRSFVPPYRFQGSFVFP